MIDELKQEMLAEQAQRLARLELRNRIHMIGLLIWGTLLLGWMIYCFVKLMVMANRTAIMQAGTIPFTCGTCGAAFDLPAEYLVKHPFIPKKSISAGAVGGSGLHGTVRMSRRLRCPVCGKKAWCRQDMRETGKIGANSFIEAARRIIPKFFLVEAVIVAAGGVFFTLLRIVLR